MSDHRDHDDQDHPLSISDQIEDGYRAFCNEFGIEPDEPLEPHRAGIEVTFDPDAHPTDDVPPPIVVSKSAKEDAFAANHELVRALTRSVAKRIGYDRESLAAYMTEPVARITEEIVTNHLAARACVPYEALLRFLRSHPTATNFDAALEFEVTLEMMTRRIIEVIASPFTRDGQYDAAVIREILRRCLTRRSVVAAGAIAEYRDRDPQILTDDLIHTEALGVLDEIQRAVTHPGAQAGDHIIRILKSQSSSDILIFVEHLPLHIIELVLDSLAALPALRGDVAVATFFCKLGEFETARSYLANIKSMKKSLRAEAKALLARIDLKMVEMHMGGSLVLLVEAEKIYRDAVADDPKCVEAATGHANVLIALGHFPDAFRALRNVQVLAADYYRGKIYETSGRPEAAIPYYNNIYTFSSNHPYWRKASARLARLLAELGETQRALKLYGEVMQAHPYDLSTLNYFVPLLHKAGLFDEAIDYILTIAHAAPMHPSALRLFGNTCEQAGRADFAQPLWLEARLLEEMMMSRRAA